MGGGTSSSWTSCCGFGEQKNLEKLTDRAPKLCILVQGGLAGLKNEPFFFFRGPGGERSFLPKIPRGKHKKKKRVSSFLFFLNHPKRVTRWSGKKDGAAFLVNRHLPRHIEEEKLGKLPPTFLLLLLPTSPCFQKKKKNN